MRYLTILSLALALFAPANGLCQYTRGRTVLYNSRAKTLAPKSKAEKEPAKKEYEKPEKRVLIVYYSWDENTKHAAEMIAKGVLPSEHFQIKVTGRRIKLKDDYNTNNFDVCLAQAKEQITKKVKPAIINVPDDVSGYDIIFLGSPNWWNTVAPPVLTFTETMKEYKGPVAPFITRGNSGLGNCEEDIKKALPKAKVLHAGLFSGKRLADRDDITEQAVKEWAKEIIDQQLK